MHSYIYEVGESSKKIKTMDLWNKELYSWGNKGRIPFLPHPPKKKKERWGVCD